jgi:hypothetical protein
MRDWRANMVSCVSMPSDFTAISVGAVPVIVTVYGTVFISASTQTVLDAHCPAWRYDSSKGGAMWRLEKIAKHLAALANACNQELVEL